ncbi:MAG: carbohydrate kinase [Chloroflexi bacterium]|nr:carbohydrate kinase [Chloroflexota bacterium]
MMTSEPLLCGLDVGTTNIKALIFTPDGQVAAQASRPTPAHVPQPGHAHYEPEELWQTTVTALRQATAQVDTRRIVSVAVASMGEAGVPLDSDNRALYPAIAWFDPRTQPQAAWLEQHIGKDRLFQITGLSLQPIFGLCKLLWLKQNEPDVFNRTVRWLNTAEYIAFRLSGEQATDYSLASRTLALDIARRQWADDILREAGIRHNPYAPLVPSGTPIGHVTAEASAATGLPTTTLVAAGGHDHVCGSLAAGVTAPGVALNSLGTAETMFLTLDKPLTDSRLGHEGFTQGAHVISGLYYVFGSMYTSGGCVEWFRSALADNRDYSSLIAEAEAVPPGSQGVCFRPHLQLASSPYDDPLAREALLAYDEVPELRTIIAIGGVTRNALWMRIKATVLKRPLELMQVSDAVSLGAAILGGLGAGVYADVPAALASLRPETKRVEPVVEQVGHYDQIYRRVYSHLYPALRPLHHELQHIKQGD